MDSVVKCCLISIQIKQRGFKIKMLIFKQKLTSYASCGNTEGLSKKLDTDLVIVFLQYKLRQSSIIQHKLTMFVGSRNYSNRATHLQKSEQEHESIASRRVSQACSYQNESKQDIMCFITFLFPFTLHQKATECVKAEKNI